MVETAKKGRNSVLPGVNDLLTTHPEIAAEWHPTLNGDLTPEMVTFGVGRTIWWKCQHGHEWPARIYSRSYGSGCPYCSGRKLNPEKQT